ncbi:facilitated trehalose transporter Tret1-like [Planococcus citri]|uniref:facilitated trehalose transporter Tret1-like n=1 Tax=Planococcus citri TaxID=170843 RepID=UPI0031F7ECCD
MDKHRQQKHSNFNLYLTTCAANLATVSAGCTMTWTSPTLPKLFQPNDYLTITKEDGAWIGSLLPLGACFGPPLIILIVDIIGKKLSILMCTMIILAHWLVIAMINSLEVIYIARFIAGMAVGIVFNLIPVYIAEISSDETRGFTGSLFLLFLYIGFNIPYIVGPYTSILTLVLVAAAIPLSTMLLFIWVPESPHYLLEKGRKQRAYAALQWLRSYPEKSRVQQEIADLQEMLDKSQDEKLHTGSMIIRMTQRRSLKSLYYGCMLILFQQMAGYNAVVFYSEAIFKEATTISSSLATIICGLVMLTASTVVPLMSKLFRIKHLLYFSTIGCLFFLIILGIYFKFLELGKASESVSWVPIFCIVGYIISHSLGFGPYPWVIVAEIFHPSVKSFSSAFTTSICWFLCFLITRLFTTFVDMLGSSGTFWLFAGFCLIALIFLIVQLPDTQGKSFQEIQDLLGTKGNVIRTEDMKYAHDKSVSKS